MLQTLKRVWYTHLGVLASQGQKVVVGRALTGTRSTNLCIVMLTDYMLISNSSACRAVLCHGNTTGYLSEQQSSLDVLSMVLFS